MKLFVKSTSPSSPLGYHKNPTEHYSFINGVLMLLMPVCFACPVSCKLMLRNAVLFDIPVNMGQHTTPFCILTLDFHLYFISFQRGVFVVSCVELFSLLINGTCLLSCSMSLRHPPHLLYWVYHMSLNNLCDSVEPHWARKMKLLRIVLPRR